MDEIFDKPSEIQPVLIEDTTKEETIEDQTKKDAEWGPVDEEEITEVEFNKIPDGDDLKFEGGINMWVIKRIKEKYKI